MAAWTVAVRDAQGRQILGAMVEARKVSDIAVVRDEGEVTLTLAGDSVTKGYLEPGREDAPLTLLRWPLGDAEAEPVSKSV